MKPRASGQTRTQVLQPTPRRKPAGAGSKARQWKHPFDSAAGTIALGAALTIVLLVVLRLAGS